QSHTASLHAALPIYAVKRPAIVAGRQLAVGVARLAAGLVGHHEDEGVEPRVVDVDAPKTLFGGLLGGDFARPQLAREGFDGHRLDRKSTRLNSSHQI